MSVQRYISSSFWSDDWVDSLSIKEKLVYMYLLTNECTNVAGVYKITIKRIKDDTGVTREEIIEILQKYSAAGKAYYYHEYIVIPKFPKHQRIGERGKMYAGYCAVIRSLPDEIFEFLTTCNYCYDVTAIRCVKIKKADNNTKPIDYAEKPIDYHEKDENKDSLCQNDGISEHDSDLDSDSEFDLDLEDTHISLDLDIYQESKIQEECVSQSPPEIINIPVTEYAKQVFEVFKDSELPCCGGNFTSFLQRDFKIGLENLNSLVVKLHSADVIQACKNYAKVLALQKTDQTWWTAKMTFFGFAGKPILNFLPDSFDLNHYVKKKTGSALNRAGADVFTGAVNF